MQPRFTTIPESKYYNEYQYTEVSYSLFTNNLVGDGTLELNPKYPTTTQWNSALTRTFNGRYGDAWTRRGTGNNIWSFWYHTGGAEESTSTRAVLTPLI